jgi:hypothetical protein
LLAKPRLQFVFVERLYVPLPFHRGVKIAKKYLFVKGKNTMKMMPFMPRNGLMGVLFYIGF